MHTYLFCVVLRGPFSGLTQRRKASLVFWARIFDADPRSSGAPPRQVIKGFAVPKAKRRSAWAEGSFGRLGGSIGWLRFGGGQPNWKATKKHGGELFWFAL